MWKFLFLLLLRVVRPVCGSDPAVEVKADAGVSVALTWGQGGKEPGSLRGSLAWQQVGLGPGLGQEAFSSSFSLHFRSPMSLPSTLTPPTPSAQVSVKPTCICPGFTPGLAISLGRCGGGVVVSVLFSPLPLHLLSVADGEKLEFGVRWPWIQGQLLPFSGCVTSERSLHPTGPLPPHLPQGGVIPG